MFDKYKTEFQAELKGIKEAGTWKAERVIESPQSAAIQVGGREVINFCANNYLGLADNQEIIAASHKALDERGFGMASVRFICGTQDLHKQLEVVISKFMGTDDTILYSSCFDANGGLFEALLGPEPEELVRGREIFASGKLVVEREEALDRGRRLLVARVSVRVELHCQKPEGLLDLHPIGTFWHTKDLAGQRFEMCMLLEFILPWMDHLVISMPANARIMLCPNATVSQHHALRCNCSSTSRAATPTQPAQSRRLSLRISWHRSAPASF